MAMMGSCWYLGSPTHRPKQTNPHSRLTCLSVISDPPRGARPHPPGPKAWFKRRLYLISGMYKIPSDVSLLQS